MTPHTRTISHVCEMRVGTTNAVLRPGEVVTVKADGAHPRCLGPSDGVVIKNLAAPERQNFRAGDRVLIAMLNSGGDHEVIVDDPRERAVD